MTFRQWVKDNETIIDAITKVISAIAFVVVAGGVGVSVYSAKISSDTLKQHKNVAMAQVYLDVQKLGVEINERVFSDKELSDYLRYGSGPSFGYNQSAARHHFSSVLHLYYIIFRQHKFGVISEKDWTMAINELCRIINSDGGRDYFDRFPVKDMIFLDDFKTEILICRAP